MSFKAAFLKKFFASHWNSNLGRKFLNDKAENGQRD